MKQHSYRRMHGALNALATHHNQGAALLMVLLLTLVLTAVGIVAIESTVRSMQGAGNYRLRRQANIAAQSAVGYVSNRVGQKASVYWQEISHRADRDSQGNPNRYESGGFMTIDPKTYQNPDAFDQILPGETGLFSSHGAPHSHEVQYALADYRVVIRDPIDGPPAVGNSQFCFKKVLFASQVTYVAQGKSCATNTDCEPNGVCNKPASDVDGICITWGDPTNAAWAGSGVEALIGPISCQ